MLLEKGANVNAQLKRRPPYRNVPQDRGGDSILSMGATPLLRAARAGDTPMVELLLEHGALVDLPSNQGVTPLMAAAGVEYGLRVTRGRNRTDEGVLVDDARAARCRRRHQGAQCSWSRSGESAAHLLVIEQRLSDFSYDYRGRQVPSPRAMPHRTALHGAAMKGFTPIVEVPRRERRRPVREGRERPHGARSRAGQLQRAVPAPSRRAARGHGGRPEGAHGREPAARSALEHGRGRSPLASFVDGPATAHRWPA